MMYGYGAGLGFMSLLGPLTGLIVLIDLILVGIWLWQHISRK